MKIIPTANTNTYPLIRFIAPAFPEVNIFTRAARSMAPLGLVSVATSANKIWGIRVEVIDENNYRGPRDKNGLPDHEAMQKDNPATYIGFYCGLTSTMERVFNLARFYHSAGTINLAGGWHAHYCPEEALANGIDIVAHGDGEIVIRQILKVLRENGSLSAIPGISFLGPDRITVVTNQPAMLEISDLSQLPYPDFGLLRHTRKINTHPINLFKGCRMGCEFCSVKGKPRCAKPEHVFGVINWLVDTRKARKFFFVDDRLEEDKQVLMELLRMIREKYGHRLSFTVQIRLETAKDLELLEAMKSAGVRRVCVGYESPIDEDLKAMKKGMLAKNMVEWTRVLRRYFWVHAMFIYGYPNKVRSSLSVKETIKRFKQFIRRSGVSTIQVLHPVPLVGTSLRARLLEAGKVLPPAVVPWGKYDGSYACFVPDNMSLEELQEGPMKLMKWFYSPWSFWSIVKYGGHRLIVQWQRRNSGKEFLTRLKSYAHKGVVAKPKA